MCHISCRHVICARPSAARASVVTQATDKKYDYDLVIIGCGVGGHGAALHAVESVRGPWFLVRSMAHVSIHVRWAEDDGVA